MCLRILKHAEVLGPHLTYHSLPKPVSFAQNSINHKSPSSSSSNRGIRLSTIEGLQGGSPGNVAELKVFFTTKIAPPAVLRGRVVCFGRIFSLTYQTLRLKHPVNFKFWLYFRPADR